MGTPIDAFRIKQLRRVILSNLNMLYPSGLRVASLYNTVSCLDESYEFSLFTKDVVYLRNKGYIRYADEPLGSESAFRDKFAILTETGKDIADRITTDPALEV